MELQGKGLKQLENDIPIDVRRVNVSENQLVSLQGLNQCVQMTWLKASSNHLTIDGIEPIEKLKQLVTLNLSNNQLTKVSPQILRGMRQLKALVLNQNHIATLDWVPRLPSLNSLILSTNLISVIQPSAIERLASLTKLSLYV